MKRSLLAAATSIVLLGAVAACSDNTGGTAVPIGSPSAPAPTTSDSSESSTAEPTSSSSGGTSPIADVEPCDLMPASGASTLGLASPSDKKIGRGRACIWVVDKGSVADSLTLFVVIYDTLGLSDITATGTPQPVAPIGTHETVQFTDTDSSACVLSMKITDKSRVDVQVVGNTVEKACAFVPGAAKLVEPELP